MDIKKIKSEFPICIQKINGKYLDYLESANSSQKNKKIITIKKRGGIFNKLWPFIHSQSCISVKRENFENLLEATNAKSYPDIWLDFRIIIYSKYILKELYILDKNLTYYRQIDSNISSKFKYLSNNWWKRKLKYNKNLLTNKYQRHPNDEVIIKFKEMYEYAIKNDFISIEEIQMSIENKFFSTNFLN